MKRAAEIRNKGISLHFFCEYHGKCIVDGHVGRMSDLFKKRVDIHKIDNIYELGDIFELEAKDIYNNVFFRIYEQESMVEKVSKIGLTDLKLYLSYYFLDGMSYYSLLTGVRDSYLRIDADDTNEIDKRITKLTLIRSAKSRTSKYFSDRMYKVYSIRMK